MLLQYKKRMFDTKTKYLYCFRLSHVFFIKNWHCLFNLKFVTGIFGNTICTRTSLNYDLVQDFTLHLLILQTNSSVKICPFCNILIFLLNLLWWLSLSVETSYCAKIISLEPLLLKPKYSFILLISDVTQGISFFSVKGNCNEISFAY